MNLRINECEQISKCARFFDTKDFKTNQKGIFVFEDNIMLFDKYKAIIIKTREKVEKSYLFELTSEMVKALIKFSDISVLEDTEYLVLTIDDKKKTQLRYKTMEFQVVAIPELERTIKNEYKNENKEEILILNFETIKGIEDTLDLKVLLEAEKLLMNNKKMIIDNGITYSFDISNENKLSFKIFNSLDKTEDVAEIQKKMNCLKEYDWDYIKLNDINFWLNYMNYYIKNNKDTDRSFIIKRRNSFGTPFLLTKDNVTFMIQPLRIRKSN